MEEQFISIPDGHGGTLHIPLARIQAITYGEGTFDGSPMITGIQLRAPQPRMRDLAPWPSKMPDMSPLGY